MRCREPRNRHAKWRARHVVHAHVVAKRDRLRIATVLATDADLEIWSRRTSIAHRHRDQLANAALVELLERIFRQQSFLEIVWQEAPRIVATEAERGLREVVCAERKELRFLRDLVGRERCPRQ